MVRADTFVLPWKSKVGDQVSRGAALTEGSIQPKRLLAVHDVLSVETYLLAEVQKAMQEVKSAANIEEARRQWSVSTMSWIQEMEPSLRTLMWPQTLRVPIRICLSLVEFLQLLVQSLWELPASCQTNSSCQRLPSRKQLINSYKDLRRSVIEDISLDPRMLSSVNSCWVQGWLITVTESQTVNEVNHEKLPLTDGAVDEVLSWSRRRIRRSEHTSLAFKNNKNLLFEEIIV